MTGISLVMATIGRVKEVERFISSLVEQTCHDFELIVVDQNLDQRLSPIIEAARAQGVVVTYIRQVEPNQCMARNAGLNCARYLVVAFPDDDCWYEPHVVERVLARMCAADQPDGVIVRWGEQDPIGKPAHWLSNANWRQFRDVDASMITEFFRRELLVNLGGFDPALGLHSWFGGGEETDLMFRIMDAGARVTYSPDILVHHTYFDSPSGPPVTTFHRYRSRARGTGALYVKHHLSLWVVTRGLITPWVRTFINVRRPTVVAKQLGMALGRLEGYLRWRAKES